MENSEKTLTEQESLLLIGQMIQHTKQTVQENGFIFLLWGWLVFAASISHNDTGPVLDWTWLMTVTILFNHAKDIFLVCCMK